MSAVAKAETYTPSEPTPLVPERGDRSPYPVAALGPVLAGAVRFIVEATRCAPETAAQSVLAAAALATQAHADILTPAGWAKPLSLFLGTVAKSGERKSAADNYALAPVREVQDAERVDYRLARQAYENDLEAWEGQRRKVAADSKTDLAKKRAGLNALGPKPLPPLRPERTVEDVTVEGLIKSWTECHGSRGLFTAEGATVLAGHSMSDENRLKTAAVYSKLWEDGQIDRVRAGDGHLALIGKRMSAHLMFQPGVARRLLDADDLSDQGLTGRFLICEAPELAGTRSFRVPPSTDDSRFQAYRATLIALVSRRPRTLDGRNELDPRELTFAPDAVRVWTELHDHVEAKLGTEGELGSVKPFGNKLAEHAARIAGVLTVLEDPGAVELGAAPMARGCALAGVDAGEAVRLNAESRVSERLARAEGLRTWLVDVWTEPLVSLPDVMQRGPRATRLKTAAEAALAALVEYGWLVDAGPGAVAGSNRKTTYRVFRGRVHA